MWEVLVVGGGPAGLAAALTLGRVRRSTLVVDSGEPRNAPSPAMHNFLSRDGTPPAELRAIAREQLSPYPSVHVMDGRVTGAVRAEEGAFEVTLAEADPVRTKRILLASGVRDALPPVEGLAALWGTRVLHCPYCHGHEVAGGPLAVLGAEEPRVRLALHLTRLSPDVVLCTGGDDLIDSQLRTKLDEHGVRVDDRPLTRLEPQGDDGLRLVFADSGTLDRAALFVQSRPEQRSALAAGLGCALLDDGTVEVNELGRTSIAAVYAAGDMARRVGMPGPAAAVIAAAASGALAAAMIDQDLVTADYGLRDRFAAAEGSPA